MIHFFTVTNNVLISVLTEWLEFKHILIIDTSACNEKYREYYLGLLRNNSLTLPGCTFKSSFTFKNFIYTLRAKQLRVHKLIIPPIHMKSNAASVDTLNMIIDCLGSHCQTQLQNIDLSRCYLSSTVIGQFSSTFSKVRVLNLSHCKNTSTSILEPIVINSHHIQSLSLANWPDLTDDAVISILQLRKQTLQSLDISQCNQITDITIDKIITHLSTSNQLSHLNILKCSKITFTAITRLLASIQSHFAGFRSLICNHFSYTVTTDTANSTTTNNDNNTYTRYDSHYRASLHHHLILTSQTLNKKEIESNITNDVAHTLQLFPALTTLTIEGMRYKVLPTSHDFAPLDVEPTNTAGGGSNNNQKPLDDDDISTTDRVGDTTWLVKNSTRHSVMTDKLSRLTSLTVSGSHGFKAPELQYMISHCGKSLQTLNIDCCLYLTYSDICTHVLALTNRPTLSVFSEFVDYNSKMGKLTVKCPKATNNSIIDILEHYYSTEDYQVIHYIELYAKCYKLEVGLLHDISRLHYCQVYLYGLSISFRNVTQPVISENLSMYFMELYDFVAYACALQVLSIHSNNIELSDENILGLLACNTEDLRFVQMTGSFKPSKRLIKTVAEKFPHIQIVS